MADDTTTIDGLVYSLIEQLDCDLLTYHSTNSFSVRPGPQRHLFPTGPYALKLCHPGDEIHFVCITDNSSNTFWEYIAEKLDREDLPKHDCIVSRPGDEATVWLHYCSIPPYFDLATVRAYGFPKYSESTYVPHAVRHNLARLQDTWHLLDRLGSDLDTFRYDYKILSRWAEAAGIFSKAFGTLDAESLVWMLFDAKSEGSVERQSTIPTGILSFVNHHNIGGTLTPSGLKAHAPPPHIATTSQATIEFEIDQLSQHPDWISLSTEQHYERFCNSFQALVLVSAECWVVDRERETFHSRLINQITHLPQRLHAIELEPRYLRIWPHAVKPSEDEWMYVVGVNRLRSSTMPFPIGPYIADQTLRSFVSNTHLDLDTTVGMATLTVCSTEEALALPARHVAPGPSPTELCPTCRSPPASSPSPSSPSKKFPPASSVLSRLRWDPAHTHSRYEVGYLDRFEGLMWLPLEQWGRATEEEDFIPEHRIRVFRRVEKGSVGTVVWDREERVCELDG